MEDITNSVDTSLSKFWEIVKDREAYHAAVHGVSKSQTWLNDLTTTCSIGGNVNWQSHYGKWYGDSSKS